MVVKEFVAKGVLASALLLLCACQPKSENDSVEFRVPVTVAEVGLKNVEDLISTTGTIRAPNIATLTVKNTGVLQIPMVKGKRLAEGDRVKKGDVIANITGEDVRLVANMRAAEEKLNVARKNLDASTILFEKKLISVANYGADRTAYEDAKHEYERALHSQESSTLVTPIDGVVLKLVRDNGQLMANGQLVEQGRVIAEIAPLDSLVAEVDLIGKDIARVQQGLEARVQYYAWPQKLFAGKVVRLAPTVDDKTRALRAEIEIDNSDGLLRPGMFVEVALVVERREQVPVVARRALTQRGGRRVVFVVSGQRAQRREVELGLGDDEFVEIRKGVSSGDRVVVLGLQTLTDQMPVRVTGS